MGVLHFLSAWVNRHQQPEVGHLSKHERFQLQKKVLVGAQSWQIPQWHPQKEIIYIYIIPPPKKKKHIRSFMKRWMKAPMWRYVHFLRMEFSWIFNITKKLSFLRPLLNSSRLMRWSLFESKTWRFQISEAGQGRCWYEHNPENEHG